MRFLRRVWYALRQGQHDDDLREELAFHHEMKQRELERAGASPAQAASETRRTLGNDLAARARARDVWMSPWLLDVLQDVRFGVRLLVKDRRLTLAAIAALAVGLGATTTAFTFVRGALLRDLPIPDADRLVFIQSVDAHGRLFGISYADGRDWREAARSFSHLALSLEVPVNIAEETLPAQRYYGSFVSHDLFAMVGQTPALGRSFHAADHQAGAPRVAILAHSVWHSRYGADPLVIGRTVRLNDVPATIIGVMPPRFHFLVSTEVWVPLAQVSGDASRVAAMRGNRPPLVLGVGRLADGIGVEQARAELDAITRRLARDHPTTNTGISARIEPLVQLLWGSMRNALLMVMGAVSFVLLIACVNVANLLLARAVHRGREMAVRTALGATRWRIVRQLSVESILLTAAAAALGLLLSVAGVRIFAGQLLQMFADAPPPYWLQFEVDGVVFGFLSAVGLGCALLFGLAPAVHIGRVSQDGLKDWSRGATGGVRARRWVGPLMAGELALTLILLAGTGLLFRSFLEVAQAGRVIDTENLLTMQVAPGARKYPQPGDIKRFYEQLDDRLAAIPALSAVTVASDIPMRTVINATREVTIEGRAEAPREPRPMTAYFYVGPRYFRTLGLPLVRGRDLTADDGAAGREGVVVNQRFASMFFPGVDPVGERIRLANPSSTSAPQPWFTIVGVVPTVPQIVVRESAEPLVYVPVRGEPAPHRFVSILLRADGDRAATIAQLREAVRQVDADLPLYGIKTMNEILAISLWQYRVFGSLFALLAGIALLLSTIGLYAVTAHAVTGRMQEIGVRVALGAQPPRVIWLFVQGTLIQLAIGLAAGLAGAMAVGQLLARRGADPYAETFLVRTAPADPLALGLVSLLLILVATTASVWPARRAARVNPVVALRHE